MNSARIQLRQFSKILALASITMMLALSFERVHAAVTVSSLNAQAQASNIQVRWTTASEINNSGFYVYRAAAPGGPFSKISGLIPVAFPNAMIGSNYSYTDATVATGQVYYYKLQAVEGGGFTQDFGPVSAGIGVATSTPTSPTPTRTRTATAVPSATMPVSTATATTPSNTVASSTSTASSPTPVGAVSTSTPFPTRVALFVNPSAPTVSLPTPPQGRPNNPIASPAASNGSVAVPTTASLAENPVQQNPALDTTDTTDESAADQPPTPSAKINPLLVALTLMGGAAVMIVIAVGAASFYLIARKFIP